MNFIKLDNIVLIDLFADITHLGRNIEFEIYCVGEMRFMGRNDRCFCGSGKKVKHCHSDINEKSLVAKMLELYSVIDKRNANAQSICKIGCSQCCRDDFEVFFSEYIMILHYLCANHNIRGRIAEKWLGTVSASDVTNGACVFLDQKSSVCKIICC
ncbi:MAG: SEC-C metal-binding domain-containing protein [Defluviitaleaceae bacterium]|nr:SEC-C metal-binding domain-containing protein [Defluviitaleaceae bacterium]